MGELGRDGMMLPISLSEEQGPGGGDDDARNSADPGCGGLQGFRGVPKLCWIGARSVHDWMRWRKKTVSGRVMEDRGVQGRGSCVETRKPE